MRTGSNLLEANLNALEGVTCHGEAFNPHFIGRLKSDSLLDITLEDARQRSDCGWFRRSSPLRVS